MQRRAGDNALTVFTAAVERYPGSARLQIGLGIAQYSRGKYSEAVASFCRAVDLDPADPRPYDFLGEIYGIAPELASEVTDRIAGFVKAHPKNAMAHLYYALSLWRGERARSDPDDLRLVETLLKRAVTLDPRLARCGAARLLCGQSALARQAHALRALHLDDAEPSEHSHHLIRGVELPRPHRKVWALAELVMIVLEELAHGHDVDE